MPRRPAEPCWHPLCPLHKPCPEHGTHQRQEERRPSVSDRGYDLKWRRTRAAFLKVHTACVDCSGPATVADHDPVTRAELLERGDPHPDAWHHLRPRCGPCHSRKTALQDGGFGRPKAPPSF